MSARGLLRATHLEPTLAVTAITCVLAWDVGRGAAGVMWTGAAVFAGQCSVGWSNDWLDRHRDRAAGRTDKPIVAGSVGERTVLWAAVVALTAAVPLSLASGAAAAAVHLVAVASAWAYNLGVKFSPASPLPYAASFGLLPVFVTVGADVGVAPWWAIATAALLGAGAHFTQSLPDLEEDEAQGLRGLPHRLGPAGSLGAAAALFGAGAAVVTLGPSQAPGPVALTAAAATVALVAGLLVAGLRGRRRLAWRLTILAALCLLAAFLGGPTLRPV
jgi:4-hydroxybenzoate polyprenyltransferase